MKSLSVCIVIHDEVEEIRGCLESVAWADEIVVAETGAGDRVGEICRKYTDRVFRVENRLNPNENKNRTFSEATGDWILCLDPDERVPENLKAEILKVIGVDRPGVSGYFLPRKNLYFGTWLRHGGAYPDRQLRLFRAGKGSFPCTHIHERISVEGGIATLHNPLIHHTYRSIGRYFEKLDFKTEFEAGYLADQGVEPGLLAALRWTVLVPSARFIRRYLFKGGFLDGWSGFMACALDWVTCLVGYQKLVERGRLREGEVAGGGMGRFRSGPGESNGSRVEKILIARTDRIGDVVLTLPLASAIKARHPSRCVAFLVDERLRRLVQCAPGVDEVISAPPSASGLGGLRGAVSMARALRKGHYGIAVVVSPTVRNALATFLAGIPTRIGTKYRVGSVFFNRRVAHHRRPSVKHEVAYNFDLLAPIGVRQGDVAPVLIVPEEATGKMRRLLEEKKLRVGSVRLIALHPGSGGSSANWPPERFSSLVDRIEERDDMAAILTGSATERGLVDGVVEKSGRNPARFDGALDLVELAALYRECDVVVANSTGPLHVAMAVGTPVVGLYCNLKTCSPARWGPYGNTPHIVLTPEEGACLQCIGGNGEGDCMASIDSADVLESIIRLLDRTAKGFCSRVR